MLSFSLSASLIRIAWNTSVWQFLELSKPLHYMDSQNMQYTAEGIQIKISWRNWIYSHLSCFSSHLSCGCFIITIIPTCLSENWFYATRQNGMQRKVNCCIVRFKNTETISEWHKGVNEKNALRVQQSLATNNSDPQIYRPVCHWKGADRSSLRDKYGGYLENCWQKGCEANLKMCNLHDKTWVAQYRWDGP